MKQESFNEFFDVVETLVDEDVPVMDPQTVTVYGKSGQCYKSHIREFYEANTQVRQNSRKSLVLKAGLTITYIDLDDTESFQLS